VPLRAELVDHSGQPTGAAGVVLMFRVQVDDQPAVEVPASATLEASWSAPGAPSPRRVQISAQGKAGERMICPAGPVEATLSDLGLGFDASGLPKTCYVGLPCVGGVVLQRSGGASRGRADALLSDPATQVVFSDNSEVVSKQQPTPNDHYRLERSYTEVGERSWELSVGGPGGSVGSGPVVVRVRPGLQLRLPAELDFGTVPAGTATLSSCQRLDFGGSEGAEEHPWSLELKGQGGCQARPVLAYTSWLGLVETLPLSPRLDVEALDPQRKFLNLCLEVPRCAGEVSPEALELVVAPRAPEFANQAAHVRLRWRVEGRSWLSCNGWWVWPVVVVATLLWLAAGVLRPARFGVSASIRVAGNEKGLKTAPAILLRDCPGSGAGFYRDARLGLHGDGSLNGRLAHAPVVLWATRDRGAVLRGPGPVEVQDRRSLKWRPVEDLARGHMPDPSAVYRSGGTCFKVEPQ
jgi:hypothetical protein